MRLQLRPYQEGMREFAAARPMCALWAGPGLGKTATALTVMQDSLRDRWDVGRWLVVAPRLVALDAWPRQLQRWDEFRGLSYRNIGAPDFGLKAEIDQATGRRTGLTFGGRADKAAVKKVLREYREDIHLVAWHMLPWLVRVYGANWPYDGLVLDESIFAANSTSLAHRAAWHVVQNLRAVARCIQLTGAPIPNGYEQLHGQIRLLDGGAMLGKSLTEFRHQWMTPETRGRDGTVYRWKLRRGAKEEIDSRVSELAVSLRTEDYLQLPPMMVNPVWVTLPPRARELYDEMERELLVQLEGRAVLAPNEAVKVFKLMQLANGAVYDGAGDYHGVHAEKLERLEEIVSVAGGPVLLAYSWEHDWQRIRQRFGAHAHHVTEAGALDRFRAGKIKLMGMHPGSGAHGLDGLQDVSSTAVWFGATHNADHWLQFNKRLHRDGQRADRVMVHQLMAADTIEEYVSGVVLAGKVEGQDGLLEAVGMRRERMGGRVSQTDAPAFDFAG